MTYVRKPKQETVSAFTKLQNDVDDKFVVLPVYRKSDLKKPALLLFFREFDNLQEP